MKSYLKQFDIVVTINRLLRTINNNFVKFDIVNLLKGLWWFGRNYTEFVQQKKNHKFPVKASNIRPCLSDKTTLTAIEPVYFFQDTWAAKKIFEIKPEIHFDVGSHHKTIGLLSQFTPVVMIDIRPLPIRLDNLFFQTGSILQLPFADNSIDSISSLCVVEHIGLGRYGDPLDVFGSEKAIKELQRVVSVGGILLFSVPIDSQNKVFFNAHRVFTRDYIIELFSDFELLDEKYQYGFRLFDHYAAELGFGTGLFMFKKSSRESRC